MAVEIGDKLRRFTPPLKDDARVMPSAVGEVALRVAELLVHGCAERVGKRDSKSAATLAQLDSKAGTLWLELRKQRCAGFRAAKARARRERARAESERRRICHGGEAR